MQEMVKVGGWGRRGFPVPRVLGWRRWRWDLGVGVLDDFMMCEFI